MAELSLSGATRIEVVPPPSKRSRVACHPAHRVPFNRTAAVYEYLSLNERALSLHYYGKQSVLSNNNDHLDNVECDLRWCDGECAVCRKSLTLTCDVPVNQPHTLISTCYICIDWKGKAMFRANRIRFVGSNRCYTIAYAPDITLLGGNVCSLCGHDAVNIINDPDFVTCINRHQLYRMIPLLCHDICNIIYEYANGLRRYAPIEQK